MGKSYIVEPNHFWIPVDNGEWFCSCRWFPNYWSGPSRDEQVAEHVREIEAGNNTFVAVRCEACKGTCFQTNPANGFEHYCLSCQGSGVKAPER